MKNSLLAYCLAFLMGYSSQLLSSPLEIVSGSINVGDLDVTLQAGYRGTLNNSSVLFDDVFDVIDREAGIVGVTNKAVADSEVSVTVSEQSLQIDGTVNAGIFFAPDFSVKKVSVSNRGSLVFNITEDSFFDYSWGEQLDFFTFGGGTLSLKNEAGDFILECRTAAFCFQGSLGKLFLSQGEYALSYAVFSEEGGGSIFNSDINFTFQASPVPLPAAVWLFISGLAGLFMRIR